MLQLDHTWADLHGDFWEDATPSAAVAPALIAFNGRLAAELGLDLDTSDPEAVVRLFAGADVPTGARPVAMAYAGHQFGNFVPRLGDGRATLLGDVLAPDGRRYDLQLKGAGPTAFSRGGDGLAAVGPVLREYVVSEAMNALGIPTTRALAAVSTGGVVYRERPLPGAVLTRVASSHVRVGTFEYFAARGETDRLRELADYVIARNYPSMATAPRPYVALFRAIADRQVALVANWMRVGFVHGVMNTDNTSVAGETIDYGPCAFLDTYRESQTFSSIDHGGRYRYGGQGRVIAWNLSNLASCLVPIAAESQQEAVDLLTAEVEGLPDKFRAHWLGAMAGKLGITDPEPEDAELVERFLGELEAESLDFTISFRELTRTMRWDSDFHVAWRGRLDRQGHDEAHVAERMRSQNPARIPRNHRVEEVIEAAYGGMLGPFKRLQAALASPYEDAPEFEEWEQAPAPHEVVKATFCGT